MNECRSLYIHIPICLSRCRYCDFASHAGLSPELREAYLAALCRELEALPSGELQTVYFGGGTPSLLTEWELSRIFESLTRRFRIKPHAEISLECNPATASAEKLKALRALGITRLSIGVQSLSDAELSALGRAHTAADAVEIYHAARAADFASVSLDLMYGLPLQTKESFLKTLDGALSLSPDHLSAYGLILEEGTPLYAARETTVFPSEDEEYDMYEAVVRRTGELGFSHYEISNYAREGHACRHNLAYWHREPYHAVGLAASSFDGRVRRTHTRELSAYLSDPLQSFEEVTELSDADAAFEEIMLSLRLGEGLSLEGFRQRHGFAPEQRYRTCLAPWLKRGLLVKGNGRLSLTDEGLYLSSALLSEILASDF